MRTRSTQNLLRQYFETCKKFNLQPSHIGAKLFIGNKNKKTYKHRPFSGTEYKKLRIEFGFKKGKKGKRNDTTFVVNPRPDVKIKNSTTVNKRVDRSVPLKNRDWMLVVIKDQSLYHYTFDTKNELEQAYQKAKEENCEAFPYLKIPTAKVLKDVLKI
jgi:hypothetical protein